MAVKFAKAAKTDKGGKVGNNKESPPKIKVNEWNVDLPITGVSRSWVFISGSNGVKIRINQFTKVVEVLQNDTPQDDSPRRKRDSDGVNVEAIMSEEPQSQSAILKLFKMPMSYLTDRRKAGLDLPNHKVVTSGKRVTYNYRPVDVQQWFEDDPSRLDWAPEGKESALSKNGLRYFKVKK